MTTQTNAMDWTPRITEKLRDALDPVELDVWNESAAHAGHAGSPGTGNSHFRVRVVSSRFVGTKPVERHRMIYTILAEELASGVHALAIEAEIPGQ